jgi:hypothetical protein
MCIGKFTPKILKVTEVMCVSCGVGNYKQTKEV